jgi:carboxypeptidase Taq
MSAYLEYKERMQQVADFRYSAAVLQWDQETYMPVKGEEARARQLATLSQTAHERFTDPALGQLIRDLTEQSGLSPQETKNVLRSLEDYEKEKRLSPAFVRRLSETVSKSFQAWMAARAANDFSIFAPVLDQLIVLKREEADRKGYIEHPYDALLHDYEKGSTVRWLDDLFARLIPSLQHILDKVRNAPQVDNSFLHGYFPKEQQWAFGLSVLGRMGLDFEAARQDKSEHPFTTNFSSKDVRVTTRINEADFSSMTWSCIHEGGHALYEQGLPENQYGLPLGEACSLSIHESQSRLWENNVGRGLPFWESLWPILLEHFPGQFKEVSPTQFYRGINRVEPSLIRTESDELTYHFHIVVRYELEKRLMDNSLSTKDIPAFWNEHYKKYLGLDVPDDRRGCLQDVHWSHGSFGYFPTYTLGSLYAAQFNNAARASIPNLESQISSGQFQPLLGWLRENIHQFGRYYDSEDLCKKVTREPLNPEVFLDYAKAKFGGIYTLSPDF